jgi:hypothetical protein
VILRSKSSNSKKNSATRNGSRSRHKPATNGACHNNGGGKLTTRTEASNDRFEREDWTQFRSLRTLSQISGVPPDHLRRLIAKELADNALDTGCNCRVGELPDGGFFVEDDGPGIAGDPKAIAYLFSFRRPLASSKIKRMPTRGALGNGLRVVAGAVFASNGRLRVLTSDYQVDLAPQESGKTRVLKAKRCLPRTGTRIEVHLGESVPDDDDTLEWAQLAIAARGDKPIYEGLSSPYWHDSDSFFELCNAAGPRTVQDVLGEFDGYDVNRIKAFVRRHASSLSHQETEELLQLARSSCIPLPPERLNLLRRALPGSYCRFLGTLQQHPGRGRVSSDLPYTVEAWCEPSAGLRDTVEVLVNRSPIASEALIERASNKAEVTVYIANCGYSFVVGRKPVRLKLNIQTPHMPVLSSGKEPDIWLFHSAIEHTIEAAARACQRANRSGEDRTGGFLPSMPKGRPSDEKRAKFDADMADFVTTLKEIYSRLDFRPGSRGLCYILENAGHISKGDFQQAQKLITECRKNGLLPVDFTAEDDARAAENVETRDKRNPAEFASESVAATLQKWKKYSPGSFWDNQRYYCEVLVEKYDLKALFLPVCQRYHVPIINSRGWSDLNLRASLMRRFQEQERQGRQGVLLCCNDHDPFGLQISNLVPKHLEELAEAVDWSPRNLIVERFGLNLDFIESNNLTWIDGLETSSGKDLGDPRHKQHKLHFVQAYIANFGKRKVEANALVVLPEAGRQLCQQAIEKHLDLDAVAAHERWIAEQREQAKEALSHALRGSGG